MATAKLRSQRKEPWGWESRIDILDEDGKTVLVSKTVLDQTQLTAEEFEKAGRFTKLIKNYEDSLTEVPVKTYTESEVTSILREKQYLGSEEKFSEAMPTKPTTAEEARP